MEKTILMIFTNKKNRKPASLVLDDKIINESIERKFLDVIINNRLNWTNHINIIKDKARKYGDILKP